MHGSRQANRRTPLTSAVHAVLAFSLSLVSACSGDGSTSSTADKLNLDGDVPIAYSRRSTALTIIPTDGTRSAPGGDLMLRDSSSPSAAEHNLTARFTQGRGDASDPEVSCDGRKIVFSMRCPAGSTVTVDGSAGVVVSCLDLTAAEKALLADGNCTMAAKATDAVQDNAPASYGIYVFDPAKKT